jgi:CRISPR-associated protein Csx3
MDHFPAILIGGPPHSGKSVLTYSLTHALRQLGIPHYVIRAAPDGEGDWANESKHKLVCELRYKGDFTPEFTDFICDSLRDRHLPLLVDMGGHPTAEQERIFDYCTHTILLTPTEAAHRHWHDIIARHHLPCIADLTSTLQGENALAATDSVITGVLAGLDRHKTAKGPAFQALVERIAELFTYDAVDLFRIHERLCVAELVIDLQRLARTFDVPFEGQKPRWKPYHLPAILNYLPSATPLGLYGRGANWIYAAVALLTLPAAFYQFDARLGWAQAQPLRVGTSSQQLLHIDVQPLEEGVYLNCRIPQAYLFYDQLPHLVFPPLSASSGVLLGGKLPYWLYTSMARTYRAQPWIAVFQPQIECAVVIHSKTPLYTIGDCIHEVTF